MNRLLLATLLAAALHAQVKPLNPGFEQGDLGASPQGWSTPTASAGGFAVRLADQGCRTGARCATMTGTATPAPNAPFGNLMQSLPAQGYTLRRVRFTAAVRVEGENTRAQMWLRLDRANGSMAFLENMQSRPILSREWKTYEIATEVPADIDRIHIGVLLFGPGTAWVDDVSFDIIGEILKDKIEPARPLTAQGLTNLTAFAKLYGYIRHFHPSDEAARADWDTFAVEGVRAVESAADTAELGARLRDLFQPVAPTLSLSVNGRRTGAKTTETAEYLRYKHIGAGVASTNPNNIYRSFREKKSAADGLPKPYEAQLVPGITAYIPLAVFVDNEGTLPHAPPAAATPLYDRSPDDRATHLAAVIIAWNVFQHFYPYFDVVKTDWAAELPKALRAAASDPDGDAFQKTLQRLVADLHDGHGRVGGARSQVMLVPPVVMDWIENQFLITRVQPDKAEGLAPGDRVLQIDGKPIDQAAAQGRELISAATDGWMRSRLVGELSLCNPATRHMQLEVEPYAARSTTKSVDLPCGPPKGKDPATYTEPRPAEKIAELEPGIFYVDLDRVGDKEFADAVPRLEKAKGIVFDMRGYPSGPGITSLAHLTDNAVRSARWNVPSPALPDRGEVSWIESGWPVPPQKPYFTAKRAFLTDGRAISYAETVMGIVEAFHLGEIVGEPTAGTNGNVNPFKLPGGYTISWTGMKVLKHDGTQHHGIGIRPTVPASRTRKGVAENQDEILQKALEVVKK